MSAGPGAGPAPAKGLVDSSTRLSVVVPAYRSAGTLPELTRRLELALEGAVADYEIVYVCDGSPDQTWSVIEELAAQRPRVRGIHLLRNFGQHNALLCGVRSSRFEVTALMDDDLQDRPEELVKLLTRLDEGYDVVVGTAAARRHSLFRSITSALIHAAMRMALGSTAPRGGTSLRVFRTSLREVFADYSSPFANMSVLLSWATTRWGTVEVEHDERQQGSSTYSFVALIAHAVDLATSYSVRPLRFATLIGFFFTLFGIAILGYVLFSYWLHGGLLPGFAFVTSTIAIMTGAQLCSLGIVGEYLARIYVRSMGKPAYYVREEAPSAAETAATGATGGGDA